MAAAINTTCGTTTSTDLDPCVLLIEDGLEVAAKLPAVAISARFQVRSVSSCAEAFAFLLTGRLRAVVASFTLHDLPAFAILGAFRQIRPEIPCLVITSGAATEAEVTALRLQGAHVLTPPVTPAGLLAAIDRGNTTDDRVSESLQRSMHVELHATQRWARAVVPIIECPRDPRTIGLWGHWIGASSGTLRNWCSTAGVGTRNSLLLGRMIRAAHINGIRHERPENLLDVVDRRTLERLLRRAGITRGEFPNNVIYLLDRQRLITDDTAINELKRVVTDHRRGMKSP